jgi:two-component system, OmpR family, osmolarity sensor histidine kinase EnvZ
MTSLDVGIARLRSAAGPRVRRHEPLQPVVQVDHAEGPLCPRAADHHRADGDLAVGDRFVFMERHWNLVTKHLSAAVVADIAALVEIYRVYPQEPTRRG